MKNTKKCQKCNSDDIIKIPGTAGTHGVGNNVPMGVTVFSYVKVPRIVCCGCGYAEEWIDIEDIEKLKKKYK